MPEPLYLLNSSVIVGDGFLSGINPKDIKDIKIYKGAADAPWPWRNLTAHGIVDLAIPIRVQSRTFAQLGRWLKLTGPVGYLVNGLPVADSGLRIAPGAIAEIQITRATPAAPGTTVAIRTAKAPPRDYPPGTILIRGTAAH